MEEMMMNKAKMDTMMKDMTTKAHGKKMDTMMMANQGMSAFMGGKSQFPAQNPLTATGGKVMEGMMKQYGKRGKEVFYKTMHKKGMEKKWHG